MRIKQLAYAISIIGVATSLSSIAHADDTTVQPPQKVEKIDVVGSNIKRTTVEGPAPVTVLTHADIEKSGASTVVDLLSQLTTTTNAFTGSDGNSFSQGAAGASMRGLGEKNVLVLLNGRRLANYGYANNLDSSFVDLNSIPLGALEQVEILHDGASAIYGSDAVAGVINFKTRTNYNGMEASVRQGQNFAGDGQETTVHFTAGFGDLYTDKQNLLITADVFHQEHAWNSKHDATKTADHRPLGGTDDRATSLFPGSFYQYDFPGTRLAMPGCPAGNVAVDDRGDQYCRYDSANYTEVTPRSTRTGLAGFYTLAINDKLNLFAELGLNHNETTYAEGYATIDSSHLINPGDAAWNAHQDLGTDADGDATRLQVFRAVYEAGRQHTETKSDTIHAVVGAKGTIGTWDYETAYSHNENKVTTDEFNRLLTNKVVDAFTNGGYDPFAAWNDASVVNPLLTSTHRSATSKLDSWDFKATSSELFPLPGGTAGIAFGGNVSRESILDTPDVQLAANNIEEEGGTGTDGSRRSHSFYAEMNFPVLKSLEIDAALRYDHYSDFGGTTNPKIGFAWRPTDTILFRGTATTSFKAPTLPELYGRESKAYPSNGIQDWIRCNPLGYTGSQCAYYPELHLTANPALKPEKSRNFELGVVIAPAKNLSASIDWYLIHQKDTIESLDAQYLIDNEFTVPGYDQLVIRDPRNPALEQRYPGLHNGRLHGLILPYMNVGKTDTDGVDVNLTYEANFGSFGKVRFSDDYDEILNFKQSDVPTNPETSRLGGYSLPRWRNNFTIEHRMGTWDTTVVARSSAAVQDVDSPNHIYAGEVLNQIGSYTATDIDVMYSGFKNTQINVGVKNMFDRTPRYSTNLSDFLDSTTGRFGYVSLNYKFK